MSSENKIRVGLVGTGGISRSHAHACQSLDRVELCSVTDISEQALTAFCENFEVENRYLDLDQMLEKEDLDIAASSVCNKVRCASRAARRSWEANPR